MGASAREVVWEDTEDPSVLQHQSQDEPSSFESLEGFNLVSTHPLQVPRTETNHVEEDEVETTLPVVPLVAIAPAAAGTATTTSTSVFSSSESSDDSSPSRRRRTASSGWHRISPRVRRAKRMIQKDTIFHPDDLMAAACLPFSSVVHPIPPDSRGSNSDHCNNVPARARRSVLRDEIFVPVATDAADAVNTSGSSASLDAMGTEERKLPAVEDTAAMILPDELQPRRYSDKENKKVQMLEMLEDINKRHATSNPMDEKTNSSISDSSSGSGRSHCDYRKTPAAASLSAEYERQRLQAETAYYQHQAELVEMDLHQAEIELEQSELVLRQREQRINQERSRLEESFTSIQRRVEETKQEARDRQMLTAMEEKFIKYKIARCKEEERFEQELAHLKEDDENIAEREQSEKQRQDREKVRLRKELNHLLKVMNKLEMAKEVAKAAEEQSSASQSLETCVVCFEPLVNEESELGVAVVSPIYARDRGAFRVV